MTHPTTPEMKTDPELLRLLEASKNRVMTPAEEWDQRISFVYGLLSAKNHLSREDVVAIVTRNHCPFPVPSTPDSQPTGSQRQCDEARETFKAVLLQAVKANFCIASESNSNAEDVWIDRLLAAALASKDTAAERIALLEHKIARLNEEADEFAAMTYTTHPEFGASVTWRELHQEAEGLRDHFKSKWQEAEAKLTAEQEARSAANARIAELEEVVRDLLGTRTPVGAGDGDTYVVMPPSNAARRRALAVLHADKPARDTL